MFRIIIRKCNTKLKKVIENKTLNSCTMAKLMSKNRCSNEFFVKIWILLKNHARKIVCMSNVIKLHLLLHFPKHLVDINMIISTKQVVVSNNSCEQQQKKRNRQIKAHCFCGSLLWLVTGNTCQSIILLLIIVCTFD